MLSLRYDPIFPVSLLRYGVHRPPSWWAKHPEFVERQVRMVQDIRENGVKYPLCVSLLKGEYIVTVGCQRLKAIKTIGMIIAPVVIAFDGLPNPNLRTRKQVAKLFGCKLKKFLLKPHWFEAIPAETFE